MHLFCLSLVVGSSYWPLEERRARVMVQMTHVTPRTSQRGRPSRCVCGCGCCCWSVELDPV